MTSIQLQPIISLHLVVHLLLLFTQIQTQPLPYFLHSVVRRIPLQGSPYEMYNSTLQVDAIESCVQECLNRRTQTSEGCVAVNFDSLQYKCDLYQRIGVPVAASAVHLYSLVLMDRFIPIRMNEVLYNVLVSSETMTFLEGRTYCQSRGGFLLEIDTLDEYTVVNAITLGLGMGRLYVGANDMNMEGVWVTDREGKSLDPTLWKWKPGEPNQGRVPEDGAAIVPLTGKIMDYPHERDLHVLCERF